MTKEYIYNTAQHWFKKHGQTRLILPDGLFGKPTDIYQITFLRQRPRKIILELNGQYLLIFTDVARIVVEDSELVVSDFAQVLFDWQEGDDPMPHARVYKYGEVKFAPPPGATAN